MSARKYGKVDYYKLKAPDVDLKWCYSSRALSDELSSICKDHKIQALYVDLCAFLERLDKRKEIVDMTYLGGPAYLVLDNIVLVIVFSAEGMLRCGCIHKEDFQTHHSRWYPPANIIQGDCLYKITDCDIADEFEETIKNVYVKGTDEWPFHTLDFDEDIAEATAENNDLPGEIVFSLDNDVELSFLGDQIEYYFISTQSGEITT